MEHIAIPIFGIIKMCFLNLFWFLFYLSMDILCHSLCVKKMHHVFLEIIISYLSAFTIAFTGVTLWTLLCSSQRKRCRFSKNHVHQTHAQPSAFNTIRSFADRRKMNTCIIISEHYVYPIIHTTALSHLWAMRKKTYLNPYKSIIKWTSLFLRHKCLH